MHIAIKRLLTSTVIWSSCYALTFAFAFWVWLPFQNTFQPAFIDSKAFLLFPPHGVRVLSAWLLGWRAIPSLFPGVFLVFFFLTGAEAFQAQHLLSIFVTISISPAVFFVLAKLGQDFRPGNDRPACWICILFAGFIASCVMATLNGYSLGFGSYDIIAYLIGDMAGLFFLMILLLYGLRVYAAFSGKISG